MTITTFDRDTLKALRPELDAALAAVAAKHGITLSVGSIRFDGASFTAQLKGETSGKDDRDVASALQWAERYGIDASEPSTHRSAPGARLVGFNANARTRPWIVEHAGGKRYLYDQRSIGLLFPAAPPHNLIVKG